MAFIGNFLDVKEDTSLPGAKGASRRILISEDNGAPNFRLRLFELKKGGYTPYHQHPYEHEIFILDGYGELILKDSKLPLSKGDFALISSDELHQFRNKGDKPFRFICVVPIEDDAKKGSDPIIHGSPAKREGRTEYSVDSKHYLQRQ